MEPMLESTSTTTAIPPRFSREYSRVIRILQRWEESSRMSNLGPGDAR